MIKNVYLSSFICRFMTLLQWSWPLGVRHIPIYMYINIQTVNSFLCNTLYNNIVNCFHRTKCSRKVVLFLLAYQYCHVNASVSVIENHRTQTQFDDALIIKLFAFSFANSYSSCFYIAFVRGVRCLTFNI